MTAVIVALHLIRMLRNERVKLVADPISEIGPDCIATKDGSRYEADVLVIATGFDVLRFITAFEVRGRSGRSLREVWNDDDARAYLGLAIPDFPNFFCLYGPNLQPGHGGSLIFVVEMQMRYIMDLLRQMTTQEIGAIECRPVGSDPLLPLLHPVGRGHASCKLGEYLPEHALAAIAIDDALVVDQIRRCFRDRELRYPG